MTCKSLRRRMFPGLLILSLLVGNTASGPVSRAEPAPSRGVTTFFQLAQEDTWENVNLTTMSCEDRKNRTWITLQLTNSSLTAFPVCLPEGLETLDLSNNLLEEVNGTEMTELPRLRILSLRQNHLWSVRWGSEALSSLLKLDLSFNKLSSVPSCHSASLPNLRWLSLAGNPLLEIQPLAFSCYPQLQVLNLSATLLGQDDGRGIRESAFAISTDPREATDRPGSSISMLDLSGTFLEKIQPEWTRDLPNLRSLHLTEMPRLRSLDTDFFKSTPGLRELHCQDSHSLGFVRTQMFDSAPHLRHLSFENCNLSSFNPWDTNSSDGITINLYGNPLLCDCQLSWLLSKPNKVVLQKARETVCTSQEDGDRPSTSFSLLELHSKCQSESNVTVPDSRTPSPGHKAFSLTTYDATAVVATTDSVPLTTDTSSSSLIQGDAVSTVAAHPRLTTDTSSSSLIQGDAVSTVAASPMEEMLIKANSSSQEEEGLSKSTSNPSSFASVTSFPAFLGEFFVQPSDYSSTGQTGIEQPKRELRTTHATLPQESPFNKTTSDYSSGATGIPSTTDHYIHSTQIIPAQLNSTGSRAHSEPVPTRPPSHYVDDYDYDEQPKETPVQLSPNPCDYHPCRHLQRPCSELQSVSQCFCPGMSRDEDVPDPPSLREVAEVTDSSALIRWCAPNSVVHTYELVVHAQGKENRQLITDNIYPTARQYTLYNLLPYTTYHICVTASNKAGTSQTTGQEIPGNSCTSFKTKPSYVSVFAALSAASGLFLITTIILSVCLCKACKKPQGEQYGTHLVSYKNPAFDYPLKLQTSN